jgi:hypothetical protein
VDSQQARVQVINGAAYTRAEQSMPEVVAYIGVYVLR